MDNIRWERFKDDEGAIDLWDVYAEHYEEDIDNCVLEWDYLYAVSTVYPQYSRQTAAIALVTARQLAGKDLIE